MIQETGTVIEESETGIENSAKMDLGSFKRWLVGSGIAPTTAQNYRSLVRSFFHSDARFAKELLSDPPRLAKLAKEQDDLCAVNTRHIFRAAMRSFLKFEWEGRGSTGKRIEIDFRDRRTGTHECPHVAIAETLRLFRDRGLRFTRIEQIRWRRVSRVNDKQAVIDFDSTKFYFPLETIRQLSIWAGNGKPAAPDLPLIPIEPGATFPMPAPYMRRIAIRG